MKKKVFIACAMRLPQDEKLIEEVKKLAKFLAKTGWTIAQGGFYQGLMGLVVEEFSKYSDDIYMILPRKFRKDLPYLYFKELRMVEDEAGRLVNIKDECDSIIVLPGGSGTIEEFMYLVETKKYNEHNRDVIVFNYKGYFNDLFKQIQKCIDFGFLDEGALKYKVAKTGKELREFLKEIVGEDEKT